MNVYLITFKSYPSRKIIADNIIEAINKYQAYCMKNKTDCGMNNKIDCDERLNDMVSIKYIEDFDYIQ